MRNSNNFNAILLQASKYQAAARKKIAIIIAVCVVILGVVVTLIVLGALGKI